jgi:hypothetical protein
MGVVYIGCFRSNECCRRKIDANRTVKGETNPGGAPKGGGCATGPSFQHLYLLVSQFSLFCSSLKF